MIIMLNGSFGVGKTSVAHILLTRLPNAMIFDPEGVGQLVRQITTGVRTGLEDTDDFQDIPLWRTLTVATAQQLYHQYQRTLIVPMTLARRDYLDAIRSGFATIAPVYHFCLTASLSTVQQRLRARGDGPGSWPWRKALQYVRQFDDPYYRDHIPTDHIPISVIVDNIVQRIRAPAVLDNDLRPNNPLQLAC
jgi:hypothetical protein